MNKRIGVVVCHCGINIAGVVKIPEVLEAIKKLPGVAAVRDHMYCCSDPGQNMIKDLTKSEKLDAVVVACCSPTLHEPTFRKAVKSAGLNPYVCEIANIREQCSWVTPDRDEATKKAIRIIRTQVARARWDQPLEPIEVPITRRSMVIGGGVAGIQAALDIANAGYEVVLVEKDPSIGGHMAQLSETFPTLDCSQCILTPKMVEAYQHPKIKLLTYSEVSDISGYVGNFKVKVRRKPAYIDWDVCNGCGQCLVKCPGRKESEFDRGTAKRKAVYRPFPQAVPNRPVIDASICVHFKTGRCSICADVCPLKAIRYEQKESFVEESVGAIVIATGFELYDLKDYSSFGMGKTPDVIDGLQFERILSASGPTSGEVKRPSDGKVPKRVVFVQCAGSRDPENGKPYCSKICCMYTAKHAMLYKHRVHDGDAIVFYIDVRTGGKGFEEFYKRATDEGVLYVRGKVSKIYRQGDKVVVWGADTLTGQKVQVEADMVVLANAMVPTPESAELAGVLKAQRDEHGFFNEAHPKLRPVETLTAGYFLAGAGQGPKDIPEAVAQASGAASKVIGLFSNQTLSHDPPVAGIDEDTCSGCGVCVDVCPYGARELVEKDVKGKMKKVIKVNEVLCECCGACSSACPVAACEQRNLRDGQIQEMVEAGLES